MRGFIQCGKRAIAYGRGLFAWAAGIVLVLGFSAKPSSTPVVVDEIYWIGSAYYFHLAAHARDFSNPDWRLLPARENPPVAKFLIGAALAVVGETVESLDALGGFYLIFSGVPGAWGDSADQAKRQAVVARMSPDVRQRVSRSREVALPVTWLHPARGVMILCVATASLFVFLVGRALIGTTPALLVSICLPLHPIAREALNHALSDAPALMFSTAAISLVAAWFRSIGRTPESRLRTDALAVSAGVVSGFACATKMNSLVVIALAATGLAFLLVKTFRAGNRGGCRAFAISGGLFAVASLIAFLAVNPALYGDWQAGVRATFEEHRNTAGIQAAFLPGSLIEIPQRLGAVGTLIGFNNWSWLLPFACAILLLLKPRSEGHRFLATWWLVAWIMVTAWIPFPWLRYAAPLLAPTLLLLAATADWFLPAAGRGFGTRPAERP